VPEPGTWRAACVDRNGAKGRAIELHEIRVMAERLRGRASRAPDVALLKFRVCPDRAPGIAEVSAMGLSDELLCPDCADLVKAEILQAFRYPRWLLIPIRHASPPHANFAK
jgi:hypothetical protein